MNKTTIVVLAAVIVVACSGIGVGAYFFLGGNNNPPDADYTGSTVDTVTISLDGNNAYAAEVDTSSQEFQQLINSTEYKKAVIEIKLAKQAEADSLRESINDRILAEYKHIDQINKASGYNEGSTLIVINDFHRALDSDYHPIESLPTFLIRYNYYLEAQDADSYYQKANQEFRDQLPKSVLDVYKEHNMNVDYHQYRVIRHYFDTGVTRYLAGGAEFNENIPEGMTMEFIQDLYALYDEYIIEKVDKLYVQVGSGSNYTKYVEINNLKSSNNNRLNDYYSQIDPGLADQIKQCIANIDDLQSEYLTKTAQIQESAREEVARLQLTSLGLN